MDPLESQFAHLCRSVPTQAKWVIVPSMMLGLTLGDRLARSGVRWANLRFTTPDELARSTAAPVLLSQGQTLLSDGAGPPLVMRLLRDLPATVPVYFRNLAHHPPLAQALWQSLSDLRMAECTGADLRAAAWSESPEKAAELIALVQAYERYLASHRLADRALLYREALAQPPASVIPADALLLEWPHILWAPLQRRFLDALPGVRVAAAMLDIPGLAPPRRFTALAASGQPAGVSPQRDSDHLAYLLAPEAAPPPRHDGSVAFFRAGSREAELEELFGQLLSDSLALDDVEIACASTETIAVVWEKARRHEWPMTVGPGLPLSLTRPGRALLAFCSWIEQRFPADLLKRLLQSGDVRVDEADGPTAGQAARLLAGSAATWGRDTYRTNLSALAQSYRTKLAESDSDRRPYLTERIRHIERLENWISRLFDLLPAAAHTDRIPIEPWLEAMAVFLSDYAVTSSPLDHEACTVLHEALDDLRVLGSLPLEDEVLAIIRGRVSDLLVGADRPRPGHLHVTHLRHAGDSGRRCLFLLGLEEGAVLSGRREDPVLLDDERAVLHPLLATSQDRVSEGLYHLITQLAALSGRVTLSFACYDLRDHRHTFPSWILLQAWRVVHPGEAWTYQQLSHAIGPARSPIPGEPDRATSRSGWWLASLHRQGVSGRESVFEAFPNLAQGAAAAAARASTAFTPYDGRVPQAGLLLNPLATGDAVSPTGLEELATCPFRYFLGRGLRIDAVEPPDATSDIWLDPMTRGALLHQLYAAVMREHRRRRQWSEQEAAEWLQARAEEELARLRAAMPPPSEDLYAGERAAVLKEAQLFLQFERRDPARRPIGFEVAFGTESDAGEALSHPEPVSVSLGAMGTLRLRGRIDRLDRLPDGTYEVVDYKTGAVRLNGKVNAMFAGGRQLQHALYALAAAELFARHKQAVRISRSSYYFPTRRGQGDRLVRPVDPERTAAVLRDLLALVEQGIFVPTTDAGDCHYCEYQRACGPSPATRSLHKVNNPEEAALTPYRRLTGHA